MISQLERAGRNRGRPALQDLLADIGKGEVDLVVVYKVDRLTRSLTDFARIIETFERCATARKSQTLGRLVNETDA